MKTNAFVFARGGSKGLPRKNIRHLSGKPLLAYSIAAAKVNPEINACFVSTDDPEIAAVALHHGAVVINRPADLAGDHSPEWLSWQHAINWVNLNHGFFDRFISLPTTSPLRTNEDVTRCLDAYTQEPKADIIITMTDSARSPWFNMVKKGPDDYLDLLIKDGQIQRRQDAPASYDMTTVAYVSNPQFILNSKSLWDGIVKGVQVSKRSAVDIDTLEDFLLAEFYMKNMNVV